MSITASQISDNIKSRLINYCVDNNVSLSLTPNTPNVGILLNTTVELKTLGVTNAISITINATSIEGKKMISSINSTSKYITSRDYLGLSDMAFGNISIKFMQEIKSWIVTNKNDSDANVGIFYASNIQTIGFPTDNTTNTDSYEQDPELLAMMSQSSGAAGNEGDSIVSDNTMNGLVSEDELQVTDTPSDIINNDNISATSGDKSTKKKKDSNSNKDDSLVEPVTDAEKQQENASNSDKAEQAAQKNQKQRPSLGKVIGGLGGTQPIIKINNYIFSSKEIKYFELNSGNFLPTMELTVTLGSGKFMVRDFPKDGDVASVFIRSYTDLYKPISNDYLITYVETTRSKDAEGSNLSLTIYGILNINYLFAEQCKAIKDKTSFDALLEIANQLQLGFVSNIKSTNDKMTWLCGYQTYKEWIDNIATHAYNDDKSFFDIWIDWYYQLNFAEMNRIYSVGDKEDSKDGLLMSSMQKDHNLDDNLSSYKTKNMLCNDPSYEKTNYYFDSMELINSSGNINIFNGYKRYVQFYDVGLKDDYQVKPEKHTQIYVDPLITEGSENFKHVQKGRAKEDYYKDTNKRVWQGIQYSNKFKHNVHPYWKLSEYINFQNLENTDKLILKLHLPKCNFNLYRGQRIAVTSIIAGDPERARVGGHDTDGFKEHGAVVDRFISANNYVILGINIIYEMVSTKQKDSAGSSWGTFRQELVLGRREWELPNVTEKIDTTQVN